jgi:hypothetical protein
VYGDDFARAAGIALRRDYIPRHLGSALSTLSRTYRGLAELNLNGPASRLTSDVVTQMPLVLDRLKSSEKKAVAAFARWREDLLNRRP